jgi:hypothetical protein
MPGPETAQKKLIWLLLQRSAVLPAIALPIDPVGRLPWSDVVRVYSGPECRAPWTALWGVWTSADTR